MTPIAQKTPGITRYFPVIKDFFAQNDISLGGNFGVDRELGKKARSFIIERGDKSVLSEDTINNALLNIDLDYFTKEFNAESDDFFVQYLTFFMSLQSYISSEGKEKEEIIRLSSPPKEAYDYVGHNKVFSNNKKAKYALMYED